MPFKKGESGNPKGRAKGAQNKLTSDVKAMVLEALNGAHPEGGAAYLIEQSAKNPAAFLTLVGKLVPLDVNGSHNVNIVDRAELRRRAEEEVRGVFGGGSAGHGSRDHGGGLPH